MHKKLLLFFCISWYAATLHAAPVTPYIKSYISHCNVLPRKILKKVRKTTHKSPLRYLNLSDECAMVQGFYIGLRPTVGSDTGKEVEIVIVENKEQKTCDVIKREKLCNNCIFSPWEKVGTLPYSKKQLKKRGFTICPDGKIHIPHYTEAL